MLIKREVFARIGTFDPRYFGYFGDIDFGLRLQRAGFRMVCAKGRMDLARRQGAYKSEQQQTGEDYQNIHRRRMEVVNRAYQEFRAKWDTTMGENYRSVAELPLERLRGIREPQPGDTPIGPVMPDPAVCQIA
jgi:hypothetical protein